MSLLMVAGLFLSACEQRVEVADNQDYVGAYELVTVGGQQVPATVSHGEAEIKVYSGIFTINADGTCDSKTVFSPPSGGEVTREVSATYTRTGSELDMQWKGAGRTKGTVQGETFTMNNEGMIFAYTKQPSASAADE